MIEERNIVAETGCEARNAAEVCEFLSEYAVYLFGCGATCIRMERNIIRMAEHLGMRIAFAVMPRHIHITIFDDNNHDTATSITSIKELPVSFDKIARLSKLSWQFADGQMNFHECWSQFHKIQKEKPFDFRMTLILISLANASFCRIFGGDVWAMSIVFCVTLIGFFLKHLLARVHLDARLIVTICSFVSATLAAIGVVMLPGNTPNVAVGTSVLYLVPGIPFINSFCDMIDRHYICAFGRVMNATVLLACLSLGLCCGMYITKMGMF